MDRGFWHLRGCGWDIRARFSAPASENGRLCHPPLQRPGPQCTRAMSQNTGILPLLWRAPHDGTGRISGRPGDPRRPCASVGALAPVVPRYQLAFDATLCRDVLAVFMRIVFGWLRRRAASRGIRDSQCGAVSVIQCFASSLNLDVHIHSLELDGVFTRSTPRGPRSSRCCRGRTAAEVAEVFDQVHRRVRRLLRRRVVGPRRSLPCLRARLRD